MIRHLTIYFDIALNYMIAIGFLYICYKIFERYEVGLNFAGFPASREFE